MSTERINIGTTANDGTGDTLRNAATKLNTDLGEIDTKDTAQDATLAADTTELGDHETRIHNLETATVVHGIPAGGATGKVLKKNSGTDYDVAWSDDIAGTGGALPTGGTAGEVLTKNSSTDGDASWAAPTGGGGTGGGSLVSVGAHKYWRLRRIFSTFGATNSAAIAEIEFRATVGGAAQAVTAAIASTEYSGGYSAANAIDGNPSTMWVTAGGDLSPFFEAQFASAVSVEQLAITARNDGYYNEAPTNFDLMYSDDGAVYTFVANLNTDLAYTSGMQQLFSVPVTLPVPAIVSSSRMITVNPPLASQFADASRYGRGASSTPLTLTDDPSEGLVMEDVSGDTSAWRSQMRAIPGGATIFEVAARFIALKNNTHESGWGLCFEDASGNVFTMQLYWNGGWHFEVGTLNGGSWNDHDDFVLPLSPIVYEWQKLGFDASGNLTFSFSKNGKNWMTVNTGKTLSTYGCGTPTKYGFCVQTWVSDPIPVAVPWFYSTEFPAPALARIAN